MSGPPAIDAGKLTRWYDLQAPLYRLWRNRYDSPLMDLLAARIAERTDGRDLLDAGTGTGLAALALARRLPHWTIEAIDLSAGMLRVARTEADRLDMPKIGFRRGSVTRLPYAEGRFSCIVAAGLFPNLPDHDAALAELARVLAPDGRLLVVEFDRDGMGRGARLFMATMILGYRAISTLLPRYRFARGWNIQRSTLDRVDFERRAARVPLRLRRAESRYHHLILELEHPSAPSREEQAEEER